MYSLHRGVRPSTLYFAIKGAGLHTKFTHGFGGGNLAAFPLGADAVKVRMGNGLATGVLSFVDTVCGSTFKQ